MSDSAQKALRRNRPPRVHISYQDPYDESAQVELPFVMGVMADLSGNASAREKPKVADRPFTQVDPQSFDDFMASVEPAISLSVPNKLGDAKDEKLGMTLTFRGMDDLDPGRIADQVPALRRLLDARRQLANLQRYMNGKSAAQDMLRQLLSDPELMKLLDQKTASGDSATDDDQ
ncbi:type VI secretion system contractile sheath small subunit [Roseinatronobacter alkalisoli]|uniref:Type VI secretion system contractile sheath small subunit n=1 Tax=Roseinatronobacter alkalisoli TaxID=3028235 RepID=A0ABT5TCL3_9RHOB|nr:type VI secretion system contractile sheath small subunit [Roseinatronobacter sp. HJB301]MDD7972863.1 type VI secretion system contractile sheath small subunit [Roseinatronobacter sp. HJB301]